MARYINVDDLLKDDVGKRAYDPVKYTDEYGFVVTVEDILKAPSIDVPERNVGKWIPKDGWNYLFECSECGEIIYSEYDDDIKLHHAFCGCCGADTRKETEDDEIH